MFSQQDWVRARSYREKKEGERGTMLERERESHRMLFGTKQVSDRVGKRSRNGIVSFERGLSFSEIKGGNPILKNPIHLLFFYWLFSQLPRSERAQKACWGRVGGYRMEQEVEKSRRWVKLCLFLSATRCGKAQLWCSAGNSEPLGPWLSDKFHATLKPSPKSISPAGSQCPC